MRQIVIEEFEDADDTLSVEEMEQLITDKDPYLEFYKDTGRYLEESPPDTTYWVKTADTARFHRIVDNNKLDKYLKQLK